MKKLIYIAAALLVTLAACNKNNSEVNVPTQSNVPAWVADETLPVPVLFNTGALAETKTKSGLIDEVAFLDQEFTYGVTALDLMDRDVRLFQTSDNHVEARNVANQNHPGHYLADFGSVVSNVWTPNTYYYPLQSSNYFTFFGYRTNEDNDFSLTWVGSGSETTAQISDIEIGHQDILWASAAATGFGYDGKNYDGFNAKYIRNAWKAVNNVAADFYSRYAPNLHFNHITTAFQFYIKTDPGRGFVDMTTTPELADEGAKKFEAADIYVTGIKLTGLHNVATLDVLTGVLSTSGNTADIDVQGIDPPQVTRDVTAGTLYYQDNGRVDTTVTGNPVPAGSQTFIWDKFYPQFNEGNGNPYGEALLVLPTDIETAAGNTDPIQAIISFHVPNQSSTEDIVLDIEHNGGGFLAGKRYVFTILVHSPEEIEVVTSIAAWDDADTGTYEPDIEIE